MLPSPLPRLGRLGSSAWRSTRVAITDHPGCDVEVVASALVLFDQLPGLNVEHPAETGKMLHPREAAARFPALHAVQVHPRLHSELLLSEQAADTEGLQPAHRG